MDTSLLKAEIDLKAIAHNVKELRRITHPKAQLMAVVKANGYGHGVIEVAQCALQNGASALGVARIEEGDSNSRSRYPDTYFNFRLYPLRNWQPTF